MENGLDNYLKEVITADDCATCKLCCNFHRESVWESPCLSEEYTNESEKNGMKFASGQTGAKTFVYEFDESGLAFCPMLDTCKGCTLKEKKPFECKIWPIRVMTYQNEVVLGKYIGCPAIQGDNGEVLNKLVNDNLRKRILDYASKHKEIVRPFDKNYEIIRE